MKEINTQFYTVSVRTFVILFNYGSGCGFGSAKVRNKITVPVPLQQKVTVPTVPVLKHWIVAQ